MNKKIINKKGFTLIELLAVISILAIIAVIVTPNIITLVDNSKKQEFVSDASSFASKALYKYKFEKYYNLFTENNNCKTITLRNIGLEEKTDPDGNNYDLDNSIIKICEEENNGLKEKVSYILLKSTTTETDKRVRGIFDNNSSDKTVNVDTLGIKDVLDLKDLK